MTIKDKNLYYVGGVVRDEFLGIESLDVDYCYEGNAIDFAQNLNVIKTNPDFGTVRVIDSGKEIDIASTRKEFYPKAGHLPFVEQIGCSLMEDLSRRDFTINAMAKNTLNGELYDPFNGLDDLKEKKLRVLHDNSFIDDPSRILRGLKFSVRFGFELEETTKRLQDEYLTNINYDISYHRLKKELKETFNLNKIKSFDIFIEQNIYKLLGKNQVVYNINPKIEELVNKYKPENVWLIYLASFDLSNFELNSQEKEILACFQDVKNKNFVDDIEVYSAFKNLPLESILLYVLNVDEQVGIKYLDNLSKVKIEIDGNDLKKIGIPQGKVYSQIFEEVLKAKIHNPSMSKEEEIELVKSLGFNIE